MRYRLYISIVLSMQFSGYKLPSFAALGLPTRLGVILHFAPQQIFQYTRSVLVLIDFVINRHSVASDQELVEDSGFEPLTFSVQTRRSTN
jgi:hypothetical protein